LGPARGSLIVTEAPEVGSVETDAGQGNVLPDKLHLAVPDEIG
jgi:hypothetical protein